MANKPIAAPQQLADLLDAAASAGPADRIDWRDRIAAYGAAGIDAVAPWVRGARLGAFAVRVIERTAAEVGTPKAIAAPCCPNASGDAGDCPRSGRRDPAAWRIDRGEAGRAARSFRDLRCPGLRWVRMARVPAPRISRDRGHTMAQQDGRAEPRPTPRDGAPSSAPARRVVRGRASSRAPPCDH